MSVKEIVLQTPLKVNGKELKTLSYDTNEMTLDAYGKAEALRTKITKGSSVQMPYYDSVLHACIGIQAIIAVMPEVSEEDLLRLKGFDVAQLGGIGMRFFSRQEQSQESSSENQQEDMQDTTTAQ